MRRFNTATKEINLKFFIEKAIAGGNDVDSKGFDRAVINAQIDSLKDSNSKYIRMQRANKRLSKEELAKVIDVSYNTTYGNNFSQDYKPSLIRGHIEYALKKMTKQVASKIKKHAAVLGKPDADRKDLMVSMMKQIEEIKTGWKRNDHHVLQEYYAHMEVFSQQIKAAWKPQQTIRNNESLQQKVRKLALPPQQAQHRRDRAAAAAAVGKKSAAAVEEDKHGVAGDASDDD